MNSEKIVLKFGLYSSLSLIILTIITWGFGMIAVPPAGPYCPSDCMSYPFYDILSYYPRDYYWMYLAIFQLFAYLIFIISNHFITTIERKIFSFLSVAFSFLFLGLIFSAKNRLEKAIRLIGIFSFLFTVLSFIYYSIKFGIDRSYRFEVATITINWLTIISVGILISILIKNRIKMIK